MKGISQGLGLCHLLGVLCSWAQQQRAFERGVGNKPGTTIDENIECRFWLAAGLLVLVACGVECLLPLLMWHPSSNGARVCRSNEIIGKASKAFM